MRSKLVNVEVFYRKKIAACIRDALYWADQARMTHVDFDGLVKEVKKDSLFAARMPQHESIGESK